MLTRLAGHYQPSRMVSRSTRALLRLRLQCSSFVLMMAAGHGSAGYRSRCAMLARTVMMTHEQATSRLSSATRTGSGTLVLAVEAGGRDQRLAEYEHVQRRPERIRRHGRNGHVWHRHQLRFDTDT